LFVAIRFGFGPALITNFFILMITYIFPKLISGFGKNAVGDYNDVSNIFLGANLLFAFAAILGRLISDMKQSEANLIRKNAELKQANKELDRFVYSVSHDLSAPLKSILGLVNISRLDKNGNSQPDYLNRIEKSVTKLETFITQILDFSKNKRQELVVERIQLKMLCDEILDNLRYAADFKLIEIEFSLEQEQIYQDKTRLKIVVNNFLTNAVKFQKKYKEHKPHLKISSYKTGDNVRIEIEDNGEGIKKEQHDKIFGMFYRGHEDSTGSGLGLYIAKETAETIGGTIFFESEYGKGSVFGIEIKDLHAAHLG
jgi:signal transduction histidine kinase